MFALAALCVLLAWYALRLRGRLRGEGRRFGAILQNVFESAAELDLTQQVWRELSLLNSQVCKTAMPEPLPRYLERFVRERVFAEDAARLREQLTMAELEALSREERALVWSFGGFCLLASPAGVR